MVLGDACLKTIAFLEFQSNLNVTHSLWRSTYYTIGPGIRTHPYFLPSWAISRFSRLTRSSLSAKETEPCFNNSHSYEKRQSTINFSWQPSGRWIPPFSKSIRTTQGSCCSSSFLCQQDTFTLSIALYKVVLVFRYCNVLQKSNFYSISYRIAKFQKDFFQPIIISMQCSKMYSV
jgi:hypothetical protein